MVAGRCGAVRMCSWQGAESTWHTLDDHCISLQQPTRGHVEKCGNAVHVKDGKVDVLQDSKTSCADFLCVHFSLELAAQSASRIYVP